MFTYLLINILSIALPLLFSFHQRIRFNLDWKFIFPGIIINTFFFVLWDHYFTAIGIWQFNPAYVTGIYIFNLPLEEYLFFICIPYSCLFLYKIVCLFFYGTISPRTTKVLHILFSIFFLFMATRYFSKAYSSTAAVAAFVYLWFLVLKKVNYLNKFYLMYFISLFFFFIVNGILTALPVVMYNDFENSGIRLYTIPLEDTMYSFIMLLIPVSVYEYLKAKTDKQLST